MTPTRTTSSVRSSPAIVALGTATAGVLIGMALTMMRPVSGVDEAGTVVRLALPIARLLLMAAAITTVGLSLLPILARGERARVAARAVAAARRAALASALVWGISALTVLVLATAEFRAASSSVGPAEVLDYVATVDAGRALLIVAGLALAHATIGLVALRTGDRVPAEVSTGVALLALLPIPATGHAASVTEHQLLLVTVELHVLSAVTWAGGLGAMLVLLAAHRTLLARAVPRFSPLATVCVLGTAATGVLSAIIEIQASPTAEVLPVLLDTGYGYLLIGKSLCLIAIALVGSQLRFRLLPRIRAHSRTAFAGWATLELAIMGVAFGLAVVLSRTSLA